MKTYSILLIAFFFSINLYSQTVYKYDYKQGYRFIKKAERKLKNNKLRKAEMFIAKAKLSSYGFCGNAWIEAYDEIHRIEFEICNKREQYDKALTILDSSSGCNFGVDCYRRDSLKIVTLFLKFGKEKVINSFKNIGEVHTTDSYMFDLNCWVFIDDLNYKFWFKTEYPIYENREKAKLEIKNVDFKDLVKGLPFYKLIE